MGSGGLGRKTKTLQLPKASHVYERTPRPHNLHIAIVRYAMGPVRLQVVLVLLLYTNGVQAHAHSRMTLQIWFGCTVADGSGAADHIRNQVLKLTSLRT